MKDPELRCEHCLATFMPVGAQAALFAQSRAKGMRFVMLDCPHCHHGTAVDPGAPDLPRVVDSLPSLPCPIPGCDGQACFVDTLQPALWGCGHCGSTWPDRAALAAAAAAERAA